MLSNINNETSAQCCELNTKELREKVLSDIKSLTAPLNAFSSSADTGSAGRALIIVNRDKFINIPYSIPATVGSHFFVN